MAPLPGALPGYIHSLEYLWLLSRENSIPDEISKRFLEKATALGFDVGKLEWMNG